ncbi:MAG: hypothetical protein SFV15_23465 [Polyangiaceae bacterium]|nr:hypothetical protein [Polyangiaceae bacterium]
MSLYAVEQLGQAAPLSNDLIPELSPNPDPAEICELAAALGRAADKERARNLAGVARERFPNDAQVQLAVGAMYLALGKLVEAQAFYVQASRADPKLTEPFARLGLILLRRGDALRSQKAFERAFQLGDGSDETRQLFEQAASYLALQARDGNEAVAKEVANAERRPASRAQAPPIRRIPPRVDATSPTVMDAATVDLGTTPPPVVASRTPPIRPPRRPEGTESGAERVLRVVRQMGLFESAEESAAWADRPTTGRRPWRALTFGLATLLVAGAVTFGYGKMVRARRAELATSLNDTLARQLADGAPKGFGALDVDLKESFRLDPARAETARIWLDSLVLRSLLRENTHGFQAALMRARDLGLPAMSLVCATAAAALEEGDVLNALQTVLENDALASRDPYFQLVAAAVFEQAGVEQAAQRYSRALELAPQMFAAQVLAARYGIIEHQPQLAESALAALGKLPASRQKWELLTRFKPSDGAALTKKRSGTVKETNGQSLAAVLLPLAMVEHARARFADGDRKGAREALQQGAAVAKTPGERVLLGQAALEMGDFSQLAKLVRSLGAVVAVHSGARALTVRAALGRGDIEAAERSIQDLPGETSERLLVSVTRAYEGLDAASLTLLLHQAGPDRVASGGLTLLSTGAEIMVGRGYPTREQMEELEASAAPWAKLVALDAALDTDHLDLAEKWLIAANEGSLSPALKLRQARLFRYQGKLEQALQVLALAIAEGGGGVRLYLEYIYALVQAGKLEQANALALEHASELRALSPWIQAFLDAKLQYRMRARKAIARSRPWGDGYPVAFQALAVRTLLLAEDPRAKRVAKEFSERAARYPETMQPAGP